MKKVNFIMTLSLCSGLILSSCGNSEKEGVGEQEAVASEEVDCDCVDIKERSDGTFYKGGDDYFTGVCESKNAQDKIIERTEFKNGYRVTWQTWEEVDRELVQTRDLKYYDGKPDSGYVIYVDKDIHNSLSIIRSYDMYEKGKVVDKWEIEYSKIWKQTILYVGESRDKVCEMEWNWATNFGPNSSISIDVRKSFFNCVSSKKLPKFQMWGE